ncbi:MAG: hydrogenase maturation factor, partial [Clostridiales bacterium]|nr:hydrogenase maturation factor [Clostridiales bacterium]
FIKRSKSFVENISVLNEGLLAGQFGVTSMHDVTEGGILGAVWEVAEASGVGIEIIGDNIPIEPETIKITEFYGIDPLKLISSGCMLITCKDGEGLVNLLGQHNIKSTVIGHITSEKSKILVLSKGIEEINQPETDDLYKVVG